MRSLRFNEEMLMEYARQEAGCYFGQNKTFGIFTSQSKSDLRNLMQRMCHLPIREQVKNLNRVLRGRYAYYGIAGNIRDLQITYRAVECYWCKMLSSRSRKAM